MSRICADFMRRESTFPWRASASSSAVTMSCTASSTVKKKRVISGPVVRITPVSRCILVQSGRTEPVDQATLP